MQVSQHIWDATSVPPQWSPALTEGQADLLLLFASVDPAAAINTLQQHFPETPLCGCSASGEIHQQRVIDNSITLTVIRFAHTRIRLVTECVDGIEGSRQAGIRVAQQLQQDDLIHILVFANGLSVNGSQLVAGLNQQLAPFNHISGGIAADGERFKQTWLYTSDGRFSHHVCGIGFYGQHLSVSCGSYGGWDPFGPKRRITRARGNRLYELDDICALDLYEKYLGHYADQLPASGLRFPLLISAADNDPVVCSVLGIDWQERCLLFGADIPEQHFAQLMRANVDRLIDGAHTACQQVSQQNQATPDFALLVSCVGRRVVMQQLIDEELEAFSETLGADIPVCGFYSYGEIAPNRGVGKCNLHNQTLTITTFTERTACTDC